MHFFKHVYQSYILRRYEDNLKITPQRSCLEIIALLHYDFLAVTLDLAKVLDITQVDDFFADLDPIWAEFCDREFLRLQKFRISKDISALKFTPP